MRMLNEKVRCVRYIMVRTKQLGMPRRLSLTTARTLHHGARQ